MISGVVDLGRDNDARLSRLRGVLRLTSGFQLIIVEAEPGPIRNEVVRRILTWSGRESIGALTLVSLKEEEPLTGQLGGRAGVVVTGLEPPSPIDTSLRDWIEELNWSRDGLPGLVPGPFVLVVSQAIHGELFERAPDFYSWRRHAVHVQVTARELATPLSSSADPYWLDRLDLWLIQPGNIDFWAPAPRSALDLDVSMRLRDKLGMLGVLVQSGDADAASSMLDEIVVLAGSVRDREDRDLVLRHVKLARADVALLRRDYAAAATLLDDVEPSAQIDALALLRGLLHAGLCEWDAAVDQLRGVSTSTGTSGPPLLRARAQECLCQVAFARGAIMLAREELRAFIAIANQHVDRWGIGLLLRLADAIVDIYPDEVAPLLDAALLALDSVRRLDANVMMRCLRAKRAWLLRRAELAQAELERVRRYTTLPFTVGHEDIDRAGITWNAVRSVEVRALFSLCDAGVALVEGGSSAQDIATRLGRACELYRQAAPRRAALAGILLAELWTSRDAAAPAAAAYRAAAADARGAGDVELAITAELGELEAAVESGFDPDNAVDRLRAIVEQLHATGEAQIEGVARLTLGRWLFRRGECDATAAELQRALECFVATTDADRESQVVELLDKPR